MNLNGSLSIVFAASLSIILSACGGGGGSSSATSSTTNNSSTNNPGSTTINTQAPSVTALPRVVNPMKFSNSAVMPLIR